MKLGIAFYTFLSYILILIALWKRQYKQLLPVSILVATFFVCVISPVYAEMRYAYNLVIIAPVMFAVTLHDPIMKKAIKKGNEWKQ